jgi:hypothetical protein
VSGWYRRPLGPPNLVFLRFWVLSSAPFSSVWVRPFFVTRVSCQPFLGGIRVPGTLVRQWQCDFMMQMVICHLFGIGWLSLLLSALLWWWPLSC